MVTGYEKKQLKLIKEWKYEAPRIIMQSWDMIFLPPPPIIIPYLPYDSLQQVVEMPLLQAQVNVDTENLLKMNHVSLEELKSKGLEFSNTLVEKVYGGIDFSGLEEKEVSVIMEFLLDIPDIVSLALRLAHKVGICYGYEPDQKDSLAALVAVSANPYEQAEGSGFCLENIDIRGVVTKIGLEIAMRKFIVQNPYLSIFIGKSTAKWYVRDVGMAAQRIFQKKWFIDHDKWN